MPETITVPASVELAVVERSGFVESRHAGAAIVLNEEGVPVLTLGDVETPILPRSSLKPLQALGSLSAGATLEGEHLALSTASHAGTDRHVAVVREMLASAGLSESDLGCPPQWPTDTATRDELVRELGQPERIRMNCSGKHAAMLLACRASGWDLQSYLEPSHPLQVHIREVIERLAGEKITATAIDGCGAPVHALSLAALARATHRIGTSSERSPFALHRSAGALVRAVREHPWAIDGTGRPDTVAIESLGVFAKGGAEGIMIMVAPGGTTVALKVLDGAARATTAIAIALLERVGAVTPADAERTRELLPLAILGGGGEVGRIRATV